MREPRPIFSWDRARDALGPVSYTLSVDGRRMARTTGTRVSLRGGTVAQGPHQVLVVAVDSAGQRTIARPEQYRLDRPAPVLQLRVRRRQLRVRIVDPGGRRAPARPRKPRASPGATATTRPSSLAVRTTRYARAGRFTITVVAVDAAGNRAVVKRRVQVR